MRQRHTNTLKEPHTHPDRHNIQRHTHNEREKQTYAKNQKHSH